MYHGEVSIPKDDLSMFLDVAQQLGVKGLSEILEKEKNSLDTQETNKMVPSEEIKTESMENETVPVDDSMNINETIVMVNPEIVRKNKFPSEKWEIKADNVCETVATGDDMNDVGCESGSIIIKEELPDVSDIGTKPSCLVIDKCFSMNKDFITEGLQRTYKSLDIQKTKEEPKLNLYEKTNKKESNSEVERPRLRIHKTIKYESGDSSSESCSDTEIPGIGYRRLQIQNKIICRICRKRIPKASLKQHLVRMHFKEKLTEIYHNVVKERQCTFCERCFLGYGPSAIIEHIGAFHNKVFDFYKT